MPLAHEGHEHNAGGHEISPTVTVSESGRFTAQSTTLEVVAYVRGDDFVAYVDRADDNVPLARAKVTVDVDGKTLETREPQPGVCRASVGTLAPGRHQLTVAVGDGMLG